MLDKGENILAHEPQKTEIGMKYIALIEKRNNEYYLLYDNCSLIPIINGKINGINEDVNDYLKMISNFIISDETEFMGYKQPIYPINKQSLNSVSKTAIQVTGALRVINGNYFRAYTSDVSSSALSIHFYLNCNNARDADSTLIAFEDLEPVVADACSVWTEILGVNVTFTVDNTEWTSDRVANDGRATITFETSGVLWGVYSGGDILCNANRKWNLPGQYNGEADI